MPTLTTATIDLLGDDSDFQKVATSTAATLKKMGGQMQALGKTLSRRVTAPIAAAGAAALLAAVKVGNFADRLLDLEQMTGLSTRALQQFRGVAIAAGVAPDAIANAVTKLITRMSTGAEGSADLVDALDQLGISMKDAAGKTRPMADVIGEAIGRLGDMTNRTDRQVLATKLFGRSAAELAPILGLGSAAMAEAITRAEELGLVMSRDTLDAANEFRIGWDTMKASVTAATLEIGVAVIPVMESVVAIIQDKVVPAVRAAIEWFGNLQPATLRTGAVIAALVAAIGPLTIALGVFLQIVPLIVAGFAKLALLASPGGLLLLGLALLAAAWVKVKLEAEATAFATQSAVNSMGAAFGALDPAEAEGKLERFNTVIERLDGKVEDLRTRALMASVEMVGVADATSTNVTPAIRETAEALLEQADELEKTITRMRLYRDILQQVVDTSLVVAGETHAVTVEVEALRAAVGQGFQLGELGLKMIDPIILARKEMRLLVDETGRLEGVGSEMQLIAAQGIDAFTDFATGAGDAIKQFVQSALRQLARLAIMQALLNFIPGIGPFLGIAATTVATRQHGGPVSPGRAFLVGEAGPEIFVPQAAGSITPNTGGAMTLRFDASSLPPLGAPESPREFARDVWWREAFGHLQVDWQERGGR